MTCHLLLVVSARIPYWQRRHRLAPLKGANPCLDPRQNLRRKIYNPQQRSEGVCVSIWTAFLKKKKKLILLPQPTLWFIFTCTVALPATRLCGGSATGPIHFSGSMLQFPCAAVWSGATVLEDCRGGLKSL